MFLHLAAAPSLRRTFQWWRDFGRDRSAGTTTLMAFALPVVVGAAGIGVDVSSWYSEKRKLQQIADAAAMGGARVKAADQSDTVVTTVASNDAARNGYVAGATQTLTVNMPPVSGAYTTNDGAVEVIVTRQLKTLFSAAFMGSDVRTLSARAVAMVKVVPDPEIRKSVCMLSLVTSGEKAIFMNGSGSIIGKDCSIAAHSTNNKALYLNGSGSIKGYTALLKGGYYANGSGGFTFTAPAATYMANGVEDPYADLATPTVSGPCTQTNYVASSNATIQPGRYCGGILNSGSGTLKLAPGTYYIDGGNVENSGSGTIICSDCTGDAGVTLVFTSSGATNLIGGLFSNGSGKIVLPAPGPTAGQPYTGIAIYQDRRASASVAEFGLHLGGGGGDRLSGVVYIPSRSVHLNGSGTIAETGKACMSIIARKIELNGSGTIQTSDCGLMGAEVPTPKTTGLVIVE